MGLRSGYSKLYYGETSFDFVSRWRTWFAVSGLLIVIGIGSLVTRQLNLGLEFEGGRAWEVPTGTMSVGQARDAVKPHGLADAKIQVVGRGDSRAIRVQAEPNRGDREQIRTALAQKAKVAVNRVSVTDVGPSWGKEISRKATRALVIFLFAIALYITLRFEFKAAIATLVAMFHDVLFTVGVYSVFQFDVTPATVIAILTILGYSIYDGIVVFDRVDDNTKSLAAAGKMTYSDMVNVSLNQVLMRTLNTSITALLPILTLLVIGAGVMGATTLQEFALALLVGLGASAYSSIFIASPLLALLKERETRYADIRNRLGARTARAPSPVAAATGDVPDKTPAKPAPPPRAVPPRPRKKGKRK